MDKRELNKRVKELNGLIEAAQKELQRAMPTVEDSINEAVDTINKFFYKRFKNKHEALIWLKDTLRAEELRLQRLESSNAIIYKRDRKEVGQLRWHLDLLLNAEVISKIENKFNKCRATLQSNISHYKKRIDELQSQYEVSNNNHNKKCGIGREYTESFIANKEFDDINDTAYIDGIEYNEAVHKWAVNHPLYDNNPLIQAIHKNNRCEYVGGYIGNSESNSSWWAKENFSKPLHTWSGDDIKLINEAFGIKAKLCNLKEVLRLNGEDGYHHTGYFIKETDFYSLPKAVHELGLKAFISEVE